MRAFPYPQKVLPVPEGTPTPEGFPRELDVLWFIHQMLADPKYNESAQGARSAMRVEQAFVAGKQSGHVVLSDEDHKVLAEVLENPTEKHYPLRPAARLLPWIDAVSQARTISESEVAELLAAKE